MSFIRPKSPTPFGVAVPEVGLDFDLRLTSASEAAFKSRLVVPKAFVDPERAEHTTATLLESMYVLLTNKRGEY